MSKQKRVKRDNKSFEQLPNELFIEIFRSLNGVDIVYAFLQLNSHFQCLLNTYVTTFDFKSVSKAKFDFVTRQHDIHQWRSLRLSDDDETPGQIKLFCQLESFYLDEDDGNALRIALRPMSQLTKLSLYNNEGSSSLRNGQIWEELIHSSLPLLKTFQFYLKFNCDNGTSTSMDEVIASFSTPFYLFEKRWFVRCDSNNEPYLRGALYSLPSAFSSMSVDVSSFDRSISISAINDLDAIKSSSYAKVKILILNEECRIPDPSFSTSNIEQLVINNSLITNAFDNQSK